MVAVKIPDGVREPAKLKNDFFTLAIVPVGVNDPTKLLTVFLTIVPVGVSDPANDENAVLSVVMVPVGVIAPTNDKNAVLSVLTIPVGVNEPAKLLDVFFTIVPEGVKTPARACVNGPPAAIFISAKQADDLIALARVTPAVSEPPVAASLQAADSLAVVSLRSSHKIVVPVPAVRTRLACPCPVPIKIPSVLAEVTVISQLEILPLVVAKVVSKVPSPPVYSEIAK